MYAQTASCAGNDPALLVSAESMLLCSLESHSTFSRSFRVCSIHKFVTLTGTNQDASCAAEKGATPFLDPSISVKSVTLLTSVIFALRTFRTSSKVHNFFGLSDIHGLSTLLLKHSDQEFVFYIHLTVQYSGKTSVAPLIDLLLPFFDTECSCKIDSIDTSTIALAGLNQQPWKEG